MKTMFTVALAILVVLGFSQPVLADNNSGCYNCGVVKHIDTVKGKRSGTTGAIVGGVVGGAVGNQVGKGDGRKAATVAGAVGGAIIGKKVAENNDKTAYDITVKMDSGQTRVFTQNKIGRIKVGMRVKIKDGKVWPRL